MALAKSKPGVLNYGSAGPASLAHLAGALFATMSDIQIAHVPYKSTAQSVIDLISGRLDMQFATIAPSLANIRAGQVAPLAVTGKKRVEALAGRADDGSKPACPATRRCCGLPWSRPANMPPAIAGPPQPDGGRDSQRRRK